MAEVRVGCSGWSYPHWRGVFYPSKLPAREQFRFYAGQFDTVELNNSFYRQPPRERFEAWAREAPQGFIFAVKGSRYISHVKRMQVPQASVDRVVEAAVGLGEKLGPILFQFQGNFQCDLRRLDAFLPMLPTDLRFALEFRHDSWLVPEVLERLRAQRVALCIPDHPKMPKRLEPTSDFCYVRMHLGEHGIGYDPAVLRLWADRIADWTAGGIDVFVYFNNDMEGQAIMDARALRELLAAKTEPGRPGFEPGEREKAHSSA